MANRMLGCVASVVDYTKNAVKESTALAIDRALSAKLKGNAVVMGRAAIPKGYAAVATTDADDEARILNDTDAAAVDSAAIASPGILKGTTVNVVDSDDNTVLVILDGTAVVVDSDGKEIPVILDGTAPVVDSDAKERHDTASHGVKVAKVILLGVAGGAVVGCVVLPAAGLGALSLAGFTSIGPAGGSLAASWMSSITVSYGVGVVSGSVYSVLQSTAMERCITCGTVYRLPGTLNGTVYSDANEEHAVLDGTAKVEDSAVDALPGILNGTSVDVVDSDGTVPVLLSDGTTIVEDSDGNAVHRELKLIPREHHGGNYKLLPLCNRAFS